MRHLIPPSVSNLENLWTVAEVEGCWYTCRLCGMRTASTLGSMKIGGGVATDKSDPALKVLGQCPLVLLVKVQWSREVEQGPDCVPSEF
jgi:hypothetical protein